MTYPIFIFEGPDGGGKSTLASAMVKKCGAAYIHSTYRFKGRMMQYHLAQFRKALRLAQERPVVMDRFWPSEVAYGNTYRQGAEEGYDERVLAQLCIDYNVSFTFCMPIQWREYWEFYKASYSAAEEMFELDEGRSHLLWYHYRELMIKYHKLFPLNTTQNYNVALDWYREENGARFAGYILARMKTELGWMPQSRKDMMKFMSKNWKMIGKEDYRERFHDGPLVSVSNEPHWQRNPFG